MPLLPLLAALVITPSADFDGLNVGGLKPAGDPKVQGAVQTWEIPNIVEIEGEKVMMGSSTVTVTDVSVLPGTVSAEQAVALHYAGMQRLPNCFGINLSKFKAKLGDRPVGLSIGSMILPSSTAGSYIPGYVSSMAVLIGTKVYEVAQFRTSGPYNEMDFKYLKESSYEKGSQKLTLTEFPELWSQPFEIAGVPIRLKWKALPNPLIVPPSPDFAANYSAWSYFEQWNVDYELRKLKPGKTFEPEAFMKAAFVNRLQAKTFTVKDIVKVEGEDRWTANFTIEVEGGRDQKGRIELLKKDDWVAGQMFRGMVSLPDTLGEKFKLELVK